MDNRTPKNLQELLRFAIKHQQDDKSDYLQFDEDKKIFLDQVLQSMSVNVTEEFLKAISILQDSSSDQDKAEALDLIRDYIDNIDFANSFIKIEGAADILMSCIKHTDYNVCINAINIVAEMSQNNTVCQEFFLKYGVIEELSNCLSRKDPNLIASALYALSALTQNFEPASTVFIKMGGIKRVNNCLSIDSPRVFSKSCVLITAMSSQFALVKDEFAKLDTINKLTKKLRVVDSYDAEMEMVLRTMSVLIESRHCNLNEVDKKFITNVLQNTVNNNENLAECEEIVLFSKSLLNSLDSTN